jgi:hypothetical protein
MELTWGLLFLLVALFATGWFWHDSLGARERANEAALETCRSIGAGLLDGTVAFQSLRLVRPGGGTVQVERTYLFDYSLDGVTRQQGFLVMTGRRVESVGLQGA